MLAAHRSSVAKALAGIDGSAKAAAAIGATVRSVVQTDVFFSPPTFPLFLDFPPACSSSWFFVASVAVSLGSLAGVFRLCPPSV